MNIRSEVGLATGNQKLYGKELPVFLNLSISVPGVEVSIVFSPVMFCVPDDSTKSPLAPTSGRE